MIKIDTRKMDLAIYVIDLKIANIMRDNKLKTYDELKEKITKLKKEKEEIYKNNEEVIEKLLNKYILDVKK